MIRRFRWFATRSAPNAMLTLCHAPTETATADAFLASSTRSTPALATTFTARALEEARVARAAGAARTAETRETWATAIFLGCVLVCTRMGSARWAARLDSDLVRTLLVGSDKLLGIN